MKLWPNQVTLKIPVGQPNSLEPRPNPLIIGPTQKYGRQFLAIFI